MPEYRHSYNIDNFLLMKDALIRISELRTHPWKYDEELMREAAQIAVNTLNRIGTPNHAY